MIINEPPDYLGPLTREDIVGHRLVEITQIFESGEACNLVYTYYRLDSGVVFTLSGPCAIDQHGPAAKRESSTGRDTIAQRQRPG
jgi:hypothetical protein